ncbi:MAG: EAL domain-containing protein, partial [Firmicutes bacterium]|nr:EAL domain-containing protein [Bacillota bacterium]
LDGFCLLQTIVARAFPLLQQPQDIIAGRLTQELETLRALGVKVALDDVGAGYTGLKVLAMFPWDYIKIDASVIRYAPADRRLAALCRALNRYAGEIGAHVVAEGIETQEQYAFCLGLGLELGQGYLFGRPDLRW